MDDLALAIPMFLSLAGLVAAFLASQPPDSVE